MNFTACQGQDRFVYELIVKPEGLLTGAFIDIGCNGSSNTKGLEEIGWRGILLDKNPLDNGPRPSQFIQADATSYWCSKCFGNYDYLNLDVDADGLKALQALPLDKMSFRIITIEHDAYGYPQNPDVLRKPMDELLASKGYICICRNVCCEPGKPFENWYVAPSLQVLAFRFRSCNTYWKDIFKL